MGIPGNIDPRPVLLNFIKTEANPGTRAGASWKQVNPHITNFFSGLLSHPNRGNNCSTPMNPPRIEISPFRWAIRIGRTTRL